jgi:tRNA threonylcarbamoyladenosine biosynthesis protein TsaB
VKLLGIETSSAVGSVAIQTPATTIVRTLATPREQNEHLLELVDELLAEAGLTLDALDGIAFGRGPGSFTGLRIAAAVAQGFALATGVPLLPVSSLRCIAQHALRLATVQHVAVCVDAHMGEAYWGEFELRDGLMVPAGEERLAAPAALEAPRARPWQAVGGGFATHAEALAALVATAERVLPEVRPDARDLLPLAAPDLTAGRAVPPAQALPVYLRPETAWRRSS